MSWIQKFKEKKKQRKEEKKKRREGDLSEVIYEIKRVLDEVITPENEPSTEDVIDPKVTKKKKKKE